MYPTALLLSASVVACCLRSSHVSDSPFIADANVPNHCTRRGNLRDIYWTSVLYSPTSVYSATCTFISFKANVIYRTEATERQHNFTINIILLTGMAGSQYCSVQTATRTVYGWRRNMSPLLQVGINLNTNSIILRYDSRILSKIQNLP